MVVIVSPGWAAGRVAPVPVVVMVAEEAPDQATQAATRPGVRLATGAASRLVESVEEIVEHGVVLSAAPGIQKTLAAS